MRGPDRLGDSRGQVVPLFALGLIVLLAVVALAIDVSNVYAARRFYRAVADGSSLAGAQDLQNTTRAVSNGDRTRARDHALKVLIDRLGASGPPVCPTTADLVDCVLPDTPFRISIKTPSPTCVACDRDHAVQVTVHNPTFSLSFARVVGFSTWDVGITSVAGLTFSAKYALVTLRPPNPLPNGLDQNRRDISVDGTNTRLNILQGDVGTNSYVWTNSGAMIKLATGYFIYHRDNIVPDEWNKDLWGNPQGWWLPTLVPDPNYMYASFPPATTPSFATQSAGEVACTAGPDFPTDYTTLLGSNPTCYRPGVYTDTSPFNVGTGEVAYLMPGAYSFRAGGLSVGGTLLGGLVDGREGVVLVFDESNTKILSGNNAENFLLNMGGQLCGIDSCRATPAVDFAGTPVRTLDGFVLSIEVLPDNDCFSGTTPILNAACNENQNATVNLAGNGQLSVAGVIYGPSDNMEIHANQTTQTGVVGQIFSWTVSYTGGATLNQSYPGGEEIGVLRLDAACTTPATPCNP